MTYTPTDEQIETVARALAYNMTNGLVTEAEDQDRDVARAVLVAVGPSIAAKALRDAAEATGPESRVYEQAEVADWLQERADWIGQEAR